MQLLYTHCVHLSHQTCSSFAHKHKHVTPLHMNTNNMQLLYTHCVHLPHQTQTCSSPLHYVHLPHQTQTCSSLHSLCTPVTPNTNMSLLYTHCVHLPHHTYIYSFALIKYTCNTEHKHVAPPSLHFLSTPETPNSSGTRRRRSRSSSSSSSSTSSGGGMQIFRPINQ